MKKTIFGALLMLASLISTALLLSGSMANDWTIDGQHSAMWNLSRYGLTPALYGFVVLAVIGLLFALWGLVEKKD